MLLIDHLAESMYSQNSFFFKKEESHHQMICHGSKEYRPDVSKRPRIFFGFAERGSLLHTMVSLCHQLTKPWSSLAGVLLLMRGSFLQGDERIIRSIDRDRADGESGDNRSIGALARPASGFKGRDRAAVAPPFGTDLTCRSIWDAGVSGFIIFLLDHASKPSHTGTL